MNSIQVTSLILFALLGGAVTPSLSESSSVVREFCITPTNEAALADPYSNDNCSSFTLEHVLKNYKDFFASNTVLQLLPGIHEVSGSFDSIIVRDIHNFAMIGESCTSDNDTEPERCSKIECLEGSTLGLAFMDSREVTISKIHISNCSSRTGQLHKEFQRMYDFDYDIELLDVFSLIYSVCSHYTFLSAHSRLIAIDQMIFEHSAGACVAAIGVYGLQLQHSSFTARCLITALDKSRTITSAFPTETQLYTLTNLSFQENFTDRRQFGINIEFHHKKELVMVYLDRVTLNYRNLHLAYNNRQCNKKHTIFKTVLQTMVLINNFTIIGQEQSCFSLTVDKTDMDQSCYEAEEHNSTLTIQNSRFIRSSINMGGRRLSNQQRTSPIKYSVQMEHIHIQNVPCSCDSALATAYVNLRISSLTLTDSCCSGEALVNLLSADVKFLGFGYSKFFRNKGTCISSTDGLLTFSGDAVFRDNVATTYSGSTVIAINSTIEGTGLHFLFENNTGKSCGGIMARERSRIDLHVQASLKFINNKGHDGGAIALYERSVLQYSVLFGTIKFVGNLAYHNGGAVFIADQEYVTRYGGATVRSIDCALHVSDMIPYRQLTKVWMYFTNNTALYAGSAIYGGWIDACNHGIHVSLDYKTKFITKTGDPSVVSSNPSRVCICIESSPECNVTDYETFPLYPGQSFQIEAVAVGQRFGTTPAIVFAAFGNNSIKVDELQKLQNVDKFCTQLNYTIKSPNDKEQLFLTVDQKHIPEVLKSSVTQDIALLFEQLNISIPILDCPLGYRFDCNTSACACKETVQCDTNTFSILRTKHQWINATFEHIDSTVTHGVLVHNHCPLDYCIDRDQSIKLEFPSIQCNFNRSGILCGTCQGNLSHTFGSNRCKECSSMWALLVIPVFLLLGLGLVALIITLDLTVAQGTTNALIFYADIVYANQATFFPTETTNTFIRWYVAWLNLDMGIETCFISGLDAYAKTWLQFLFPLYIWVLVILIIVACRYSTLAARLSGDNAVPALGTLFLLSYTKLLRITITTFSSTHLEYPDGYIRRVWLYDGNVDFLEVKHVILFAAALLLLVIISIPYTLVLCTIQWLQRLPYHRLLSWVWKLKPLFDAHTGPYKEKHRYWAGLLLLVRVVMFAAFSVNIRNDPALNLLVTLITTAGVLTYLALVGGVHKVVYLDILEYIFLLNLIILSTATFYTRQTDGDQDKVIKTSVSIALIISVIIACTHAYLKVKSTQKGAQCITTLTRKLKVFCAPIISILTQIGITKSSATNTQVNASTIHVTSNTSHSSIELREPLLV